ncbi:isocitrate lyase/PEP mutase family protein [Georgenia sp. 10Sc9-8]|uniref:Isocitrate lyase/PEP mutase family protein n=1 Tax=Georgenia halotolerans TaxID=3028317 RepID=A0ABT5TXP4_9MICO|nr:isocitrate lyase/PEP mutase family protein [Georgenia halotolerans]
MPQHTRTLRTLIASGDTIACPIIYNPLTGVIAKNAGFDMVGVGGYALGANLMTAEPLLTLTECVEHARRIVMATELPVVVDAGAGFGSPVHVQRTVREFESAGVAGINLEDQVYPKRVHYHRGIEHVVPLEEMVERIQAAVEARRDEDFVLVARTDAMATDGYDEAIRRALAYVEAGADLIYAWPNNDDEARRAPRDIPAPTVYGVSEGNRLGRPRPSTADLADMGYAIVRNPHLATLTQYRSVQQALHDWRRTGLTSDEPEEMTRIRKEIEDVMDLDRHYELESRTVEKP